MPVGTVDELLDVGCGSMPYKELFVPVVQSYVGCDMYPSSEDVVACPADKLVFEDNRFDAVVCFQVLEHVPAPWRVLEECSRVLKPGGLVIVTIPFLFPYHSSPGDYYRFTHEGIIALSERAGLEVIEVEPQCATLPTICMILNIKFAEQLRRFHRFQILRPFAIASESVLIGVGNIFGLFFSVFDKGRYKGGFPGYANYTFILKKPKTQP